MGEREIIYQSLFLHIYKLADRTYEIYWSKDSRNITTEEYYKEIDCILDFFSEYEINKILLNFQDLTLEKIIYKINRPFAFLKKMCDDIYCKKGIIILPKDLLTHIILKKFLIDNNWKKIRIFVNYPDAFNWIINE